MENHQETEEQELQEQPPKQKWKKLFVFSDTLPNFVLHLTIAILLGLGMLHLGFNVYLPAVTNHSETITVPILTEMTLENAQNMLEQKKLRYEIIDSSFQVNIEPGVIIDQTPPMNAKVKLNRKIYLTTSAYLPPKIDIPDVIDSSVKNAQLLLSSHELKVGSLKYIDDLATNAVLKVVYDGKEFTKEELRAGVTVDKGSKIDLIVGNGLGKTTLEIPKVVGMNYEEAKTLLRGVGLVIGNVNFIKSLQTPATVIKQMPEANSKIKVGSIIELWVSEPVVVQDSTAIEGDF